MSGHRRRAPLSLCCLNLTSALVARRHTRGLSREHLAMLIGTSRQHVRFLEEGKCAATLPMFWRWARALDMNVRLIDMGQS